MPHTRQDMRSEGGWEGDMHSHSPFSLIAPWIMGKAFFSHFAVGVVSKFYGIHAPVRSVYELTVCFNELEVLVVKSESPP